MCLNMEYEMHMGTKLQFFFFQSSRLLQVSEAQLWKNQCNQERTQILNNMVLSLENPRLAGYMLTGNRSIFLGTGGSLAWLYHCPLFLSSFHTMNQSYDRISILYEGVVHFFTLVYGKHTQRLTYKIVPTEINTHFKWTWTKKTHGIH